MIDLKESCSLVIFDIEGVILPKRRFILFEVAGKRGLWTFLRAVFIGILYEIGLISIETALRRLFRLLKGFSFEEFFSLFRRIPLMPKVREVFQEVKKTGCRIALISSGIPRVFVEELAERLGADYASGLELSLSAGRLTGEIRGDVIKPEGKAIALKRILNILESEGISLNSCIVVADDRNNLSMFQFCNLRIGYNPDFILSFRSDYVVKGDLLGVLPIIKGEPYVKENHKLSKGEVLREAVHLGGFSVPFVCTFLFDRYLVVLLISAVTLLYIASELARMQSINFPVFSFITLKAAGKSEALEFVTSPIFYALGIILSLLLFPTPIGYISIATLTLGDGCATIFGKIYGRRVFPFNKGKKVEGTFSGLFFAFLGSLFFIDPVTAFIAAAIGMIAESLPLPINDNLVIPLTSGIALSLIFTL